MSDPFISAIILNWNGGDEVIGCLDHVVAQSYEPIEILVVDNGSTDDSKEVIRHRYPGIKLVENQQNLGYASGMNRGMELARGDHVLLINQDAWIRDDFIQNAVQLINRASPDVGMVGGRVYRLVDNRKTHEVVGGALLLRKRFQWVGDQDVYTEHFTFSPSFCCPVLRKTMLDDIKACCGHYFDDRYFAYGEDMDLALRAQLRGWKCVFSPDLVVWHSHSGSLGGKVRIWEKPPVFRKHTLRNRYVTIIKDLPVELIVYLVPFIAATELAVWPFFLVKSPSTLLCLVEACAETVWTLPETLRLRRRVQAGRKVPVAYLRRFFTGF